MSISGWGVKIEQFKSITFQVSASMQLSEMQRFNVPPAHISEQHYPEVQAY